MRPTRKYLHRYAKPASADPDVPSFLEVQETGQTPCRARARAFKVLEARLVEQNLPRNGWRLVSQQLLGIVHV